jgi:hypothetical protein
MTINKKNSLCLSFALLGAALTYGAIALAQTRDKTPSIQAQNTDSIAAFWGKFKGAVIKGDKETVAALSRFPISRGYGMASIKNKAQLMKHYRNLFFNETDAARCFLKAKPFVLKERPKEFIISCGS